MLFLLMLCAVMGIIPAAIAHRKGYDFVAFWVFGAVLFIVALPVAICLKRKHDTNRERQCPACAEWVKREAHICHFCRTPLGELPPEPIKRAFLPPGVESRWGTRPKPVLTGAERPKPIIRKKYMTTTGSMILVTIGLVAALIWLIEVPQTKGYLHDMFVPPVEHH